MLYNYSYVMMDAYQFKKYQEHCKRNGLPCNYNLINPNCYGIMIGNEKLKNNIEKVQKAEVK